MVVREIVVKNGSGLHSKSAAVFIQRASNFKSEIWIEREERKANAKSLLGLLSLCVGPNMKVLIRAEGEDEEKAVEELANFLESPFIEND